jgi:hypothetical protein
VQGEEGLDPILLTRARDLVKISLASATLLAFFTLLLPSLLEDATTTDMFFVFWGAFLLLASIIIGVTGSYLYLTRGSAAVVPALIATSPGVGSVEPLPDIVLRVLSEDEREIVRRLREADGMLLQKDLVKTGVFTPAKITRILDRLEYKGLVTRERHGMTNRLRLADSWKRPLEAHADLLQHTHKGPSSPKQREDDPSRSVNKP